MDLRKATGSGTAALVVINGNNPMPKLKPMKAWVIADEKGNIMLPDVYWSRVNAVYERDMYGGHLVPVLITEIIPKKKRK